MIEDDLMREIRAAKDAYARSFGYDIRAIAADLQAADARGDWPLVRVASAPPAGPSTPDPDSRSTPRVIGVVGRVSRESSPDRERGSAGIQGDSRHRNDIDKSAQIEIGATVALVVDIPASGLVAGEVGAVVEILGDREAFEVEFCDNLVATYGLHALRADQILVLRSRGQALRLRVGAV